MAHRAKLLRLPGHGKLLVSADLHGNYRDFLTIAHRFERLGEDAHLLFLGDLVHGPYLPLSQWPQGGPTVITAPFLFEELWALAGERLSDHVDLRPVSPFYRIRFDDGALFDYTGDADVMRREIAKFNPDDVPGYERFLAMSQEIFSVGFEQHAIRDHEVLEQD